MFSDELKERTMPMHQQVEKRLVTRIRNIQTSSDYVALLRLMYGLYKPLETQLAPFVNGSGQGRAADNILDDIRHFNEHGTHNIPVNGQLPPIPDDDTAMGVLYVTEGSTLGGVYITQMICKQLGISADQGFSFFNAYGGRAKENWTSFKALLNDINENDAKERILSAANDTFSTFNYWITQHE